jgi:hypothetical protein
MSGSETGGDGWYKETSYQDGTRYATVDIIVQSAEINCPVRLWSDHQHPRERTSTVH